MTDTKNQCDGCQKGIPKVDGMHRMGAHPRTLIGCTKDRYEKKECEHGLRDRIDCEKCVSGDIDLAIIEHTPTLVSSPKERHYGRR